MAIYLRKDGSEKFTEAEYDAARAVLEQQPDFDNEGNENTYRGPNQQVVGFNPDRGQVQLQKVGGTLESQLVEALHATSFVDGNDLLGDDTPKPISELKKK